MKNFEQQNLEDKINSLKDEDSYKKIPWNKNIKVKLLILLPLILYMVSIAKFITFSDLFEIITLLLISLFLILIGVILYFKMIA
tara:strand:+ start:1667 stop:1918 length:252 start_codon:yes stop_codon:yes gene_type:complete